MQDISLHLLDIIENSVRAKAKDITIRVKIDRLENRLKIMIKDDGLGMDEETLKNSQNPFFTTKNDRVKKVGLGIPLFKQNAELSDGSFTITSKKNIGTTIDVDFRLDHIDRMPLGNITDTVLTGILGHPETDFNFTLEMISNEETKEIFVFSTKEIKRELEGVPLAHPEVITFIKNYLNEGITEVYREEI
jgi:hypothetical protein